MDICTGWIVDTHTEGRWHLELFLLELGTGYLSRRCLRQSVNVKDDFQWAIQYHAIEGAK